VFNQSSNFEQSLPKNITVTGTGIAAAEARLLAPSRGHMLDSFATAVRPQKANPMPERPHDILSGVTVRTRDILREHFLQDHQYFQTNPGHLAQIIEALVAMAAEADSSPAHGAAPAGAAVSADPAHRLTPDWLKKLSTEVSGMSSNCEQDKVDQLIALCKKEKPLSASDVAAIQQLLAAGAGVANGRGKSE
jgi:hypothetical protein